MWSQLYGVCYCLSNSCAIVFRHKRRFDYRPQFQDRQKLYPLFHVALCGDDIIRRELNLRKPLGRQWESNPQPSEQLRPITIKTSASTETTTAAYKIERTLLSALAAGGKRSSRWLPADAVGA